MLKWNILTVEDRVRDECLGLIIVLPLRIFWTLWYHSLHLGPLRGRPIAENGPAFDTIAQIEVADLFAHAFGVDLRGESVSVHLFLARLGCSIGDRHRSLGSAGLERLVLLYYLFLHDAETQPVELIVEDILQFLRFKKPLSDRLDLRAVKHLSLFIIIRLDACSLCFLNTLLFWIQVDIKRFDDLSFPYGLILVPIPLFVSGGYIH